MKPTVYIETTILGHLTSRLPKDPIVAGNMVATRRWWVKAADRFDLVTAKLVLAEASQGDPQAASERLRTAAAWAGCTESRLGDVSDKLRARR